MNNPHVEQLFYQVISSAESDYKKATPISGDAADFSWRLQNDQLAIEMKTHCTTEEEARGVVDGYLRAWEITAGLFHRPGNLKFKFSSAVIIYRQAENSTTDQLPPEIIELSDEIKEVVSYEAFPPFPEKFKASPEVEMMFIRYKLYRDGHESLLGMAYWCLTVMEHSAGGRQEIADQYQIDSKVLRRLGELCSNRGDLRGVRKSKGGAGNTALKPAEREWIRAVVKRLILRAGEFAYDPIARLPLVTMAEFPALA
jgi:hypothetical protein